MDALNEALKKYRQERFTVQINPCKYSLMDNEMDVYISHNGYQAQMISLSPDEARKVIEALSTYLKGIE